MIDRIITSARTFARWLDRISGNQCNECHSRKGKGRHCASCDEYLQSVAY